MPSIMRAAAMTPLATRDLTSRGCSLRGNEVDAPVDGAGDRARSAAAALRVMLASVAQDTAG